MLLQCASKKMTRVFAELKDRSNETLSCRFFHSLFPKSPDNQGKSADVSSSLSELRQLVEARSHILQPLFADELQVRRLVCLCEALHSNALNDSDLVTMLIADKWMIPSDILRHFAIQRVVEKVKIMPGGNDCSCSINCKLGATRKHTYSYVLCQRLPNL